MDLGVMKPEMIQRQLHRRTIHLLRYKSRHPRALCDLQRVDSLESLPSQQSTAYNLGQG